MMVNFGIDLGTTNSVIAKYSDGRVEVFKNPVGHKETLPSVVAFRSGRILIGDKAREYQEKDPKNVVGSFKRKMGTSESFWIHSTGETKSPVELSSLVLKELKNFVYTDEALEAAVITIPASFDTVQSNATKKAGHLAGFQEVFLLQEPIAASLAYVNKQAAAADSKQQWLVYDLGGGTFDVALVKTEHGEMRILDHQGDNFLGGMDFDHLIIEKIIIPYLQSQAHFPELEQELRSSKGRYNSLYYILLKKAEEVKVNLTAQEHADIEFEIETPEGELLDLYFSISRTQFEDCIREKIMETIAMIREILERNQLTARELDCILMVGGSTYIPLVRQLVAQELHIPVSTAVDPTTAVVIGAAYFAGTKTKTSKAAEKPQPQNQRELQVKTGYSKVSQDQEEYFLAQLSGDWQGLFYRIIRSDGGFDSGLKEVQERFSEYLPLLGQANNSFELKILDADQRLVYLDDSIQIASGKWGILGQPLPNDICLEVDDPENGATKLELIFEKNSLLPQKKTLTKEISKTIKKGSADSILINVLEGSHTALPLSNLSIGQIEIKGEELSIDLVKGSDVEIVLEMSESRDLRISTYLMMSDQEFSNLFSPSERQVKLSRVVEELKFLLKSLENEERNAVEREEYELSQQLSSMRTDALELLRQLRNLPADDVTDAKYQLEDRKRRIARRLDELTRDKKIIAAKTNYFFARKSAQHLVDKHGSEQEKTALAALTHNEKQLLAMNSPFVLDSLVDKIQSLVSPIRWRIPEHVINIYYHYARLDEEYQDRQQAARLKERGDQALARKNYDELKVVISELYQLLPAREQDKIEMKGTGIQ